jgi:hypothetical protein
MTTWSEKLAKLPWKDKGGKYEVAIIAVDYLNQENSRFRCTVYIRERKERGKVEKRVGDGRLIGNFSPIWVNWKGKSIQLEKLLEIGW